MRRFSSPYLALCVLLGAAACGEASGPAGSSAGLAAGLTAIPNKSVSVAAAGPAATHVCTPPAGPVRPRYIAALENGAPCQAVGSWSASPLFGQGPSKPLWAQLEAAGTPLPAPLARFCVYTWSGAGAPVSGPTVNQCVALDPDPDVVVPQIDPAIVLSTVQEDRALRALGAHPATPGRPPATWPYGNPEGPAYLAIVDTADSSAPGDAVPAYAGAAPRHRHGLAMRALVEAVRCPFDQAACHDRQFFAQAFPYDATHATPLPSGGQRGSLGSLAAAVVEAVARWKTRPDAASSPLVINMSLGWDPTHGDLPAAAGGLLANPDPGVPAPVQAVYAALAWASCEGALSMAASGNDRGASCEQSGPMAPASWEAHESPAAACSAFGLPAGAGGVPLVYAAGGLDEADRPIVNARRHSMPRRAAFAHQTSLTTSGGDHTQPWTGTSLSTAALSAIAAQVWSHGPADAAATVMTRVEQHGVALPLAVDLRGVGTSPAAPVLRIDAHAAMQAVTGATNPYAPRSTGLPSGTRKSTLTGATEALVSSRLYALGSPPQPTVLTSRSNTEVCSPDTVVVHVLPGSHPQPTPPLDALSDETRPQPHVAICPNCVVRKTTTSSSTTSSSTLTTPTLAPATAYTAFLELDPTYTGATVDQPALTFHDTAQGSYITVQLGSFSVTTPQQIDLDRYVLSGGQTVADWLEQHASVTTGRVSMRVDDGSSAPQIISNAIDVVR